MTDNRTDLDPTLDPELDSELDSAGDSPEERAHQPGPDDRWDDSWDDPDWGEEWEPVVEVDRYVRVPRRSSFLRRLLWVLLGLVAFVALVGGAAAWWLQRQLDPPGDPGEVVTFEVVPGQTVTELASDLQEAGVIGNATVFRLYARWKGFEDIQAGTYDALRQRSSMPDVLDVLEAGPAAPPPAGTITLAEGLELRDIGPQILATFPDLDEGELMAALLATRSTFMPPEVQSLEGFLFPDTYRIEQGDEADEAKLVAQMMGRFDEVATELGYTEAEARTGLSTYQLVIVASLIEREAKVDEDRAKISRVIHNRLAQGMPLGVDATLLYEIGHKETLTESDLATESPYNTRLNPGLPPTPIAMPGRDSLEAAINPAEGPWLYYVLADVSGAHFFTDDYDEFLRVAQEARDAGIFE